MPQTVHRSQQHKSSLPGAGGQSAHIGVLAAMSGVTRFGEAGAGGDWSYSKNETIDLDGDAFAAVSTPPPRALPPQLASECHRAVTGL